MEFGFTPAFFSLFIASFKAFAKLGTNPPERYSEYGRLGSKLEL
jgi:hypothetical protein